MVDMFSSRMKICQFIFTRVCCVTIITLSACLHEQTFCTLLSVSVDIPFPFSCGSSLEHLQRGLLNVWSEIFFAIQFCTSRAHPKPPSGALFPTLSFPPVLSIRTLGRSSQPPPCLGIPCRSTSDSVGTQIPSALPPLSMPDAMLDKCWAKCHSGIF